MPQMAANGLSENWLFKFAGDAHWRALCRSLSTTSSQLCTDGGERLYASFVAIRAGYSAPLCRIQENDRLDQSTVCSRYGSSFFRGVVALWNESARLELEMITAFVSRKAADGNELRKGVPAASFVYDGPPETTPPPLLARSARLRKGELESIDLGGFTFSPRETPLALEEPYHPSPYVDYNGANLLYYAAYPSIADAAERRLLHAHGLAGGGGRDWAMASSTIAREVFYLRNLDLGEDLVVRLNRFDRSDRRALLHSTLCRAVDRQPIAEVFTVKELLG
jgi:probable biosynthetic protein (TIGR04098 family)